MPREKKSFTAESIESMGNALCEQGKELQGFALKMRDDKFTGKLQIDGGDGVTRGMQETEKFMGKLTIAYRLAKMESGTKKAKK